MLSVERTCGATACQPSVCSTVPRAAASAMSSRSSRLTTKGTAARKSANFGCCDYYLSIVQHTGA